MKGYSIKSRVAAVKVERDGKVFRQLHLLKSLEGKRCRTLQDLSTEAVNVPKGTVCRISMSSHGDYCLEAPPCEWCGVSIYLRRVPRDFVAVILDPEDL